MTKSASIRFSYEGRTYCAVLIGGQVELYDIDSQGRETFRGYSRVDAGLSGAARVAVCCRAYGEYLHYRGLIPHLETAWLAEPVPGHNGALSIVHKIRFEKAQLEASRRRAMRLVG